MYDMPMSALTPRLRKDPAMAVVRMPFIARHRDLLPRRQIPVDQLIELVQNPG
jgi:hypothetical protein